MTEYQKFTTRSIGYDCLKWKILLIGRNYEKNSKILLLAVFCIATLTACSGSKGVGSAKDCNEFTIESTAMRLMAAVEEGQYNLVGTEELKNWIDNGEDMIVIDTMPADSYNKNRIPTAVNAELPVKLEEVTPEQREAFVTALGTDKDKKLLYIADL